MASTSSPTFFITREAAASDSCGGLMSRSDTQLYQCGTMRPPAEVVDLNLVRLAAALHRLGEAIGADVGRRADMLKRIAPPAHEVPR